MSVFSRELGSFVRAASPKMSLLRATKRRIATGAEAGRVDRVNMSPSRHALPRDLRVLTRSTGGHLEGYKVDQPFSPDMVSQQARSFHTSPRVPYDSTSYNVTDDVPDFFVKYKEHRSGSFSSTASSESHERDHDGLGLMQPLTHSIQSGDLVATTRRLKAKIPVEHQVAGGHIVHSSGFVAPGPGHTSTSNVALAKERERNEDLDRAVQTAGIAHRVLETDFQHVDATTLPLFHKVPFEIHEPDGSVKHPSGFVPPTPAHKFRYIANNYLRGRKVSAPRPKVRQPSPARAVLRAMHTAAPGHSGDR